MIFDINGNVISTDSTEAVISYFQSEKNLYWRRGIFNTTNGSLSSLSPYALTIASSAFVFLQSGATVTAANGYKIKLAYYSEFSLNGFKSVDSTWESNKTISEDTYAIIAIKHSDDSYLTIDELTDEVLTITGGYEISSYLDRVVSLGAAFRQQTLLDETERVIDILAGYPMLRETVSNNQKSYGIPYSAKNDTEGYVGVDVSMYTYLSAVRTNKSVIYHEYSGGPNWRNAYYGIDCSGLVSASIGLKDTIPTNLIATLPIFANITDPMEIRVGDILLKTGHAKNIANIERDKYGRIIFVCVNDASIPKPGHQAFFWTEFLEELSIYTIKRYVNYNTEIYNSPLDYVFPTDLKAEYKYPDIMPYLGDKKVILAGSNVSIIVVNNTGYSSIEVYKDGIKVDTKSNVADFTISSVTVGKYEVRLIGTGITSSCYFNVASLTATLSGNNINFSASGCTPYSIAAFKASSTSSGEAVNLDKQMIHFITEDEIQDGSANIADLISYARTNGGYLKVKAFDEFGSVWIRCEV